jgi:hypothetical protein
MLVAERKAATIGAARAAMTDNPIESPRLRVQAEYVSLVWQREFARILAKLRDACP